MSILGCKEAYIAQVGSCLGILIINMGLPASESLIARIGYGLNAYQLLGVTTDADGKAEIDFSLLPDGLLATYNKVDIALYNYDENYSSYGNALACDSLTLEACGKEYSSITLEPHYCNQVVNETIPCCQ